MSNNLSGLPSAEELELINKLSRRPLEAEEVYVFPLTLCDNEVDRDRERFSIAALHKLCEMFVGRTGISDHSMRSSDQAARIFECSVESDPSRTTEAGECYHRLTAKAYLPRSEKYAELINELDMGIKKEVSISCQTADRLCSVCGASSGGCNHRVGRTYTVGGKRSRCHTVLDNPTDAYEWSFVAVPAQRAAGVTKHFDSSRYDCSAQSSTEEALEQSYRSQLYERAVKAAMIANPELSAEVVNSATEAMETDRLKSFVVAYERAAARIMPPCPQLFRSTDDDRLTDRNYKI